MGEDLHHNEGFSCIGPRLAGHATSLDDMMISTHRDWMVSIKEHADPERGWFDKDAARDHLCYSHNPLRSIGELNLLLGRVREALPHIAVPTLLIYSKDDQAMSYPGCKADGNIPDCGKLYKAERRLKRG